jgi:ATP-binding cassette, subfamily B, bacterial
MISRKKNIVRLVRQIFAVFQYSGRALELVWNTSRTLTIILATLTVIAGLLPAAIAYIGKLIVDSVILASQSGLIRDRNAAFFYLGIEAIIVAILAGSQRGLSISQSLLRVLLGQKVNVLILEKALTLDLTHFEDSEFYDKMSRARREWQQ